MVRTFVGKILRFLIISSGEIRMNTWTLPPSAPVLLTVIDHATTRRNDL